MEEDTPPLLKRHKGAGVESEGFFKAPGGSCAGFRMERGFHSPLSAKGCGTVDYTPGDGPQEIADKFNASQANSVAG